MVCKSSTSFLSQSPSVVLQKQSESKVITFDTKVNFTKRYKITFGGDTCENLQSLHDKLGRLSL